MEEGRGSKGRSIPSLQSKDVSDDGVPLRNSGIHKVFPEPVQGLVALVSMASLANVQCGDGTDGRPFPLVGLAFDDGLGNHLVLGPVAGA